MASKSKIIAELFEADGDIVVSALDNVDPSYVSDKENTSTGAIGIPSGTTAQRPSSPYTGYQRYNTDLQAMENWNGTDWLKVSVAVPSLTSVTGTIYQTFAGNLTLAGTNFLTADLVVKFTPTGGSPTTVTVTPTNDTAATVAVPSAIYNQSNDVVITVTNSDGVESNSVTKSVVAMPTGGTITTNGNNRIHSFTSSGTFTVPSGASNFTGTALIVAGGASGGGVTAGGSYHGAGGGGGAGGMIEVSRTFGTNTYTVTVGAGGAGAASSTGNNGGTSSITGGGLSGTSTVGGGRGGLGNTGVVGTAGGSGGGGTREATSGGAGTAGQGNRGGNYGAGAGGRGGGGGGKGNNGGDSDGATASTGAGGNGGTSSITGSSTTYAGGGGGGEGGNVTGNGTSPGGSGGGGRGGAQQNPQGENGVSGTANTGGGGGGGGAHQSPSVDCAGGSGGSGIVIISYDYTTI